MKKQKIVQLLIFYLLLSFILGGCSSGEMKEPQQNLSVQKEDSEFSAFDEDYGIYYKDVKVSQLLGQTPDMIKEMFGEPSQEDYTESGFFMEYSGVYFLFDSENDGCSFIRSEEMKFFKSRNKDLSKMDSQELIDSEEPGYIYEYGEGKATRLEYYYDNYTACFETDSEGKIIYLSYDSQYLFDNANDGDYYSDAVMFNDVALINCLWSTYAEIENIFGEPSETKSFDNGDYCISYVVSNDLVNFWFNSEFDSCYQINNGNWGGWGLSYDITTPIIVGGKQINSLEFNDLIITFGEPDYVNSWGDKIEYYYDDYMITFSEQKKYENDDVLAGVVVGDMIVFTIADANHGSNEYKVHQQKKLNEIERDYLENTITNIDKNFDLIGIPQIKSDTAGGGVYDGEVYLPTEIGKHIEGVVKNLSDKKFNNVEITFVTYDSNGNQIGSASDSISDFYGGGTWKFEATIWESNVASFDFAEITYW